MWSVCCYKELFEFIGPLFYVSDALRDISAVHLACLIPKGIEQFPENNQKMSGHIDIWWIVRILVTK